MPTLLVAPSDSIDAYVKKGELKPRYFNPLDFFDRVVVLDPSWRTECPKAALLMFGDAKVCVCPIGPHRWLDLRAGPFSRWRRAIIDRVVASAHPKVVRAYDPLAAGAAALSAARASGIPLVVSVHMNPDVDVRQALLRRRRWKGLLLHMLTRVLVERRILRAASVVIAVHEFAARYARRLTDSPVHVIYNRVDVDRFKPSPPLRDAGPLRIITVGTAIPERGLDLLIDAVALAPAELVIVGTGPDRQRLERRASLRGVDERVTFIDRVSNEDLGEVYATSHVYACSPTIGGVTIPVLEAAAVGLPLVAATTFAGPPEVIREVGIVTARNPEALASVFRRLIDEPDLRMALSAKSRAWALARQDSEAQEAAIYKAMVAD